MAVKRDHVIFLRAGFCADNIHNFIRNKRRLPEEVAAPLFKQVVAAIEHCHDNNIVLKDLKLRNFIFQDEERSVVGASGLVLQRHAR